MQNTDHKPQQARRKGKHLVAAWIDKPTVIRLKVLAAHQGKNLTILADEAFTDLLQKHAEDGSSPS